MTTKMKTILLQDGHWNFKNMQKDYNLSSDKEINDLRFANTDIEIKIRNHLRMAKINKIDESEYAFYIEQIDFNTIAFKSAESIMRAAINSGKCLNWILEDIRRMAVSSHNLPIFTTNKMQIFVSRRNGTGLGV